MSSVFALVFRLPKNRIADVANPLRRIPMRRFLRPDEVGDMLAFVASDAFAFTTGAVFALSGGRAT
jgi:NAD(P)-dependent dehydrogenase (short-subunit alcohol dehydrogenase family)